MDAARRDEQQSSNIIYNIHNLPIHTLTLFVENQGSKGVYHVDVASSFSQWGIGDIISHYAQASSLDEGNMEGFVQFRHAEVAAEVLNRRQFLFNGYAIYVQAADSWNQPEWCETIALPFSFNENVDPNPQFIDDCLREIFNHLDVWDLASVADVCPRFERLAQERFVKKHKSVNFNDLVFKKVEAGVELTGQHILNFFNHFGSLIVELEISYYDPSNLHHITPNEILMLVVMHCCGTLEVLKIRRFSLDNPFLINSQSSFKRLKELYLFGCVYKEGFKRALANCKELTKLEMVDGF